MSAIAQQIISAALNLPGQERAMLAQVLLRSIDEAEDTGVEAAWETEVAHRLERLQTGEATGRPAEEVFADLRARHQ